MAALRAAESERADRLFNDPYARLFLEAMPFDRPTGSSRLGDLWASHATIRTRFFDDYLLGSGCRQVVLLAAGLDTRAFRLPWRRGVRLFELDRSNVLTFKEDILVGHAPACDRVVLPVDLRDNWAEHLTGAGFDMATPTAWLAEGLLIYLAPDEAAALLTTVTSLSAVGSQLAFEHTDTQPLRNFVNATPALAEFARLWKGGLAQDAEPWLAQRAWRVDIHRNVTFGRQSGTSFLTAQFDPGSSGPTMKTKSAPEFTPIPNVPSITDGKSTLVVRSEPERQDPAGDQSPHRVRGHDEIHPHH
jgi:methyltransferase (TIGR00027 family)